MKVLLFGNIKSHSNKKDCSFEFINTIARTQGIDLHIEQKFHHAVSEYVEIDSHAHVFGGKDIDGDLAISVGGDGTFLNVASIIGRCNIPILGINMGKLGFLTDVSIDEIPMVIDCIIRKDYKIEGRTIIEAQGKKGGKTSYFYALNEFAMLKQDSSSLVGVCTTIDGEYLHTYLADGLIISTPTGSTAYALSVGGPIMDPSAKNLIIAPVASHSLSVRPLIIPDSSTIKLNINSRSGCYLLSVDGQSVQMCTDHPLIIRKADYETKVVRLAQYSFFKTIKRKLMWGMDAREN